MRKGKGQSFHALNIVYSGISKCSAPLILKKYSK